MKENIIKKINLEKLKSIFRERRTATKSELASISGLSVVTVNSLVKTLLADNEILEDKTIHPDLGRPATSYRFNETVRLALIIYMYEEKKQDIVCYSVCNLYGEIIKAVKEINKISAACFEKNIQKLLTQYPNIKVIIFSIPGEEYNGKFLICDYSGLDTNFPAALRKKFGLDIYFENDINSALYGYCSRLSISNCVGIYMPSKYPPGSAIFFKGEIIKGKNNLAGEIKYLPCGINWDEFSYSKEEMEKFLLNTIKIYMCVYNPEQIVIYANISNTELQNKLNKLLKSNNEKLMLPEIIIKNNLKDDVSSGLIINALKKII